MSDSLKSAGKAPGKAAAPDETKPEIVAPPATPLADAPEPEIELDDAEEVVLAEELRAEAAEEEVPEEAQGMFTASELVELRKQAAAKVTKDKKAAVKLTLMERFEDEERIAQGLAPKTGEGPVPDDRKVTIHVGLPPFTPWIQFDRKIYVDGHSYEVSPAVYLSLVDQMQWSWRHEDEIHGHFDNTRRRERDTHIRFGKVTGAPATLNTRTSMTRQ